MTETEFIERLKENKIVLSNLQLDQLREYAAFLKEYNEKINLTAITEYEEVLDKHFYDSLMLSFNMKLSGTLVDVGTGAGFPGVVLKIVYPDLQVILLEPLQKRCLFLKELIARLGLSGIAVINERAEDYSLKHREAYDFVTARAVTNMSTLIEICGAMVKVDGYFIALRGAKGCDEINDAYYAILTMGFDETLEVIDELPSGSTRVIAYLKKQKVTNKKYPRKYSIIKQRPL